MSFEHRLIVRFYEVDRAGIAFFGRIFEYCHAAYEGLLVAVERADLFMVGRPPALEEREVVEVAARDLVEILLERGGELDLHEGVRGERRGVSCGARGRRPKLGR